MHTPSRPFRVTLLAMGVLTIASLYLVRLVQAVLLWQFLSDLAGVSPIYLALTGLIWASASLLLFWGLWRGHARVAKLAPGFVLVFVLYYWIDKIFVASQATYLANWPVRVTLTALGLAYTFWVMKTPASKEFFIK